MCIRDRLFTSTTYAEIPVYLTTFIVAAILNKGTNYWFGTISFVTNSIAVVLQLGCLLYTSYTMDELQQCIAGQNPNEPWYRLILLEAMLFEPYYPLGMEKDKKGNDVPCKKYKHLNNPINGFKRCV